MDEQIQTTGKKSKWWLWLIIILIVIGIGVGIYFLLSGGNGNIPQPPALPN